MTVKDFLNYVFKDTTFTILVFNDLHGESIDKIEATQDDILSISIFNYLQVFKILSDSTNHFILSVYPTELMEYINGEFK